MHLGWFFARGSFEQLRCQRGEVSMRRGAWAELGRDIDFPGLASDEWFKRGGDKTL
jgi:hypothetical protein